MPPPPITRAAADPSVLMDTEAAQHRPASDLDDQGHRVRQDGVIADLAIVGDVRTGHEEVARADPVTLPLVVFRFTVTNSRKMLSGPISTRVSSPAYFRSCIACGMRVHRVRAPMCMGPVNTAWEPIRLRRVAHPLR